MRVGLYSPYLDTFGGGERYVLTVAEILSKLIKVDLLFDNHLFKIGAEGLKNDLARRFNLELSFVKCVKAPLGKGSNILERLFFLRKYDLLFYLTDGSIFYSTARKNIVHIQSPLAGEPTKSLWGKFKLHNWDLIIYNSEFTKINSQKNWPINSIVIYPPVDTEKIKPLEKKKYILSVGRFFGYLKDKKQGLLIETFKNLYKKNNLKDWSLHLAGSANQGDLDYLNQLRNEAGKFPVKFYPNLDYSELIKLYGESSIYWHAAGFGEEDPTKMEHFGISTVEAMSGGVVPVVIGKGGQTEIVDQGKSGFLWNNLNELEDFTYELINDYHLWKRISEAAKEKSKIFGKQKFAGKINELINK
ncbi:glycosyltransferase [Candidatus Daviesbacteria bacterium]|nr:glycosyltransferase [Candidatus Daviesbacteria bacterium]